MSQPDETRNAAYNSLRRIDSMERENEQRRRDLLSDATDVQEKRSCFPRREKHIYRMQQVMIDARWWTWRGKKFGLRRRIAS